MWEAVSVDMETRCWNWVLSSGPSRGRYNVPHVTPNPSLVMCKTETT
jgi:hypothetical protein